jgi:chromosome segregation ATPase
MKKIILFAVLAVLVIALCFVVMKTVALKKQLVDLTAEKQSLAFSLTQREAALTALDGKLQKLEEEYKLGQKKLEESTSQNSAIKAENNALKEEIDTVTLERDALQAKFVSIPELKKMIKELKEKQRQVDRILGNRPGAENPETIEAAINEKIKQAKELVIGNQGYIIKDGQPTYKTSVVIDVEPASAR